MRGILLIDHGSRLAEANAVVEEVATHLRDRLPDHLVAVAHLELAAPGLEDALERLVEAGATDVIVHPLFLAPGRHSTRDIPARARCAAARHPDLRVRVGAPLGAHPGIVDAVLDRVRETEP